MKKPTNGFTQREISEILNNAVIHCQRPLALKEIPEARLRCLRSFSQAMLEPCLDFLPDRDPEFPEGYLKPEELVLVLAASALYVQQTQVARRFKLPAEAVADSTQEKS